MIHILVARALYESAVDEAIDTGSITPGRLPDETLEAWLEEAIARWCRGERRYLAKCPVGYVAMEPGDVRELAEGIRLRCYTPREFMNYLSKNHFNMRWRDAFGFGGVNNIGILEIAGSYDPATRKGQRHVIETEIVEKDIADRLDLAKWALASVTIHGESLKEGWIIYELADDTMPILLDRSFLRQGFTGGVVYEMDSGQVELVRDRLTRASPGVEVGRSEARFLLLGQERVAKLARDQLLDAAMGLDWLLVKGGGDSRYRFKLHGTALWRDSPRRPKIVSRSWRRFIRRGAAPLTERRMLATRRPPKPGGSSAMRSSPLWIWPTPGRSTLPRVSRHRSRS